MNYAVAGGGRVSASFVARLPRLSIDLGPVAAQSYRLASRIVNSIGAGHAVKKYEDLDGSSLILICVPVRGLAAIIQALEDAIECQGKIILLCESGSDSRRLAPLKAKGAGVGSVEPIPGFDGRLFVTEGDREAVREAKALVRQLGAKAEEVQTAKMALYSAGLSFGAGLFTPLIEASSQCLQEAGLTKASAAKVAAPYLRELRCADISMREGEAGGRRLRRPDRHPGNWRRLESKPLLERCITTPASWRRSYSRGTGEPTSPRRRNGMNKGSPRYSEPRAYSKRSRAWQRVIS